ncbi:MAG: flagellar basal body P-ring formation chaperone FlgA [Rhodothalassiaceae bacterium]
MRLILIAIAAFLAVPAEAAQLRAFAEVDSPTITLGDLLIGAGQAADVVVRAAPEPGGQIAIATTVVQRIAATHGLDVQGTEAMMRIQVQRAGKPVDPGLVADKIRQALVHQGMRGDYDVRLGHRQLALFVPPQAPLSALRIEHLNFNDRSGRFTATLVTPAGGGREARTSVSGMAEQMTELPVLAARLAPGEVISDADLDWIRMPVRRVNRGAITHAEDLVGMSLKRRVATGQVLRAMDIEQPRMIERGQLVAMVVRSGPMTLTATGRALESGGEGDWIRIQNVSSHRVVEGRVIGPNEVAVAAFAAGRLAQN